MNRRCKWSIALVVAVILATFPVGVANAQTDGEAQDTTYTSPTFGYTFSWNPAVWDVVDEFTDDGYDFVALQSDGAELYVEGMYFYRGDPAECVMGEQARVAEEVGQEDVEPLLDRDGEPIGGSEENYVYALFDVPPSADGDIPASVAYVECQTIAPGSAVLIITAFVDPAGMDLYLDLVFELVEGIRPAAASGPAAQLDAGDVERIVRETAFDVNGFWKDIFAGDGEAYVDPLFITFTGPTETECGDAFPGETGSFYCPADSTIYMDVDDSLATDLTYGIVFFQVVVAHEVAHHVQELLLLPGCTMPTCGEPESSLAIELQADCFAGVWMQDAASRGLIDGNELDRVEVAVRTFLGDPIDVPPDDPDAHGTGDQRFDLFMAGYEDGLEPCGW